MRATPLSTSTANFTRSLRRAALFAHKKPPASTDVPPQRRALSSKENSAASTEALLMSSPHRSRSVPEPAGAAASGPWEPTRQRRRRSVGPTVDEAAAGARKSSASGALREIMAPHRKEEPEKEEAAHRPRMLTARLLQWRFANARNLVSLVGYCDENDEQMLVYEFMSNGTLRDHLSVKSKRPLSFGLRLKIALGAAKGILYLHTEADPPIFHRDVKASNILLDSKLVAKVADFGLSRLAPVSDVEGTLPAHVSTVVKGTPGYLDPEYFLTHKLTDKSDVYSLSVVFLEMLTGMKPIEHGKNIVREVNSGCQSGIVSEIIDGRMGLYPPECIRRFLSLATKCCQDETDGRPSMWELVRELELILRMMPEEDLILLESSETDSTDVSKSLSTSATGTLFISSLASGSLDASSGMINGTVTPR